MILLIHKDKVVTEIIDLNSNEQIVCSLKNPLEALFFLALNNRERILVWCHASKKGNINVEGIKTSFQLKNMMLSYIDNQYLPKQIGYVEDSPFLKVNKNVRYPTWLMSSEVGAIFASQLLKFENKININDSFDFVLNSIAKLGMPNGLLCYSESNLLIKKQINTNYSKASIFCLFKFVKQHYKGIWSVLLFINLIIYEKRFCLISLIRTLFVKRIKFSSNFEITSLSKQDVKYVSVDVIIPTLGRKIFLHDILKDLEKQILLPKQVIIIEQNEDENSKSELDFITNKVWSFKIIHKFIHQTGACNARNLALKNVTADYVFFADDDIRIKRNFFQLSISKMQMYQFDAITLSCLQKKDVKVYNNIKQWSTFGSGSSIVKSNYIKSLIFNMKYEFNYGEDSDFGMQLRNQGVDILYLPEPEIKHLKAPIGGFRTKFIHPWQKKSRLKPKPSPTIMFFKLHNTTKQQLFGYKTSLFIKFYKIQKIKNPIKYYVIFKKKWRQSLYWAKQLE